MPVRYNAFQLVKHALTGKRWPQAWRSPAPKSSYDVIIVGGGGHGLATAYYLAKNHGLTNVAVIERSYIGSGNVGRNTIISPGIIQWDASLLKNFRFLENKSLQFRFEAFNAANHPNWGIPNASRLSPAFGTIRSTRTDMRDLQFGLKYVF